VENRRFWSIKSVSTISHTFPDPWIINQLIEEGSRNRVLYSTAFHDSPVSKNFKKLKPKVLSFLENYESACYFEPKNFTSPNSCFFWSGITIRGLRVFLSRLWSFLVTWFIQYLDFKGRKLLKFEGIRLTNYMHKFFWLVILINCHQVKGKPLGKQIQWIKIPRDEPILGTFKNEGKRFPHF
jgi:hypothetical protein